MRTAQLEEEGKKVVELLQTIQRKEEEFEAHNLEVEALKVKYGEDEGRLRSAISKLEVELKSSMSIRITSTERKHSKSYAKQLSKAQTRIESQSKWVKEMEKRHASAIKKSEDILAEIQANSKKEDGQKVAETTPPKPKTDLKH